MTTHSAHVALIDQTGEVLAADLQRYATALNQQVAQDFAPVWGAHAVVSVYSRKPARSWGLYIKKQLDQPGALGYHSDSQNQPVAYVELTSDVSVTLSHELCEMLADAYGNRTRSGSLPAGLHPSVVGLRSGASVNYLLEVSDPCESTSYTIEGVAVSDFITPAWYEGDAGPYSFKGGCTSARQVAEGGYCSFARDDGEWFQVFNEGGLQVSDLGKYGRAEGARSLREWVDSRAREWRRELAVLRGWTG